MRRAQRAFDNPALETAIAIANQLKLPAAVCFFIRPHRRHANLRQFSFMLDGLADTSARLEKRRIGFILRIAAQSAVDEFGRLCEILHPALILTDRNPLTAPRAWTALIPGSIRVPAFSVDADVIVPTSVIGREHYAARTIRPPIHRHLDQFLTPVGNRAVHIPRPRSHRIETLRPVPELLDALPLDRSIGKAEMFTGGTTAALASLKRFVRDGLPHYAERRNAPELDATSHLSPYLHFGQIGPHTVALAVRDIDAPDESRRSFLEELIVRRELAIAFTVYNRHFHSIAACEGWARRTLDEHASDARTPVYTERQFEGAETHDPLWNAAQCQMTDSGWMHGYMRMYWAKKILEWSRSPAEAYAIAVRLNDKYELDGRDPNGYAGIAWAIGGKHDRAWGERPIFGKIRYMSGATTGRKFNSRAYIDRWLAANSPKLIQA
ncbi:MAG: deoxyribodipyrimidine photo-lyase [Candidatus Binataceae bacterium]